MAGARLQGEVERVLGSLVVGVEHVGSSSVVGLLAKPVVDLAAGLAAEQELAPVVQALEADRWVYRGDAGDDGGHVFVLDAPVGLRVAHLHLVNHDGTQWREYLNLRDLLRQDPSALRRYEDVKVRLAARYPNDRVAYTEGKTHVVGELLAEYGGRRA
jgi:GrpB-like predicted nucleotidyltransferase (UPF0157 family)